MPVDYPVWGRTPPSWQNPYAGGLAQQNPNNPTSQNNLAQLVLLYQSNPSSLTSQQWQQLQAAGVIPGTVPYSNAALVQPNPGSFPSVNAGVNAAAAAIAAPTSSIIGTDPASGATTILGIDWYYVAAAGLAAIYFLQRRGR
jgi:hypothetical protein